MLENKEQTVNRNKPLKRLGDVADIGKTALFFASGEASYITGQTLIVDGGQILPGSLEALAEIWQSASQTLFQHFSS